MEGDGFETDEVVASRDGRGNGGRPRAVLRDHLAISPRTAVDGAGEETGLVDLELSKQRKIRQRLDKTTKGAPTHSRPFALTPVQEPPQLAR